VVADVEVVGLEGVMVGVVACLEGVMVGVVAGLEGVMVGVVVAVAVLDGIEIVGEADKDILEEITTR